MIRNTIILLLANVLLLGTSLHAASPRPPVEALIRSGKMLNVREPFEVKGKTYRAFGDGVHDDTEALIAAVDWVVQKITDHTELNMMPSGVMHPDFKEETNRIIYLPAGIYLVSKPIEHSYDRVPWAGENINTAKDPETGEELVWGYGMVRLVFQGESKEQSIIRLKDGAPGYDNPAKPLPIVRFCKNVGNNLEAGNEFRDLTIDAGVGNPGAIGLVYSSANQGEIRDVIIRSSDPKGFGAIGLDLKVMTATGYHSNVTIEGFDCGIAATAFTPTENSFEFLTLKHQRRTGISVLQGGINVRKLHSINSVPAASMDDPAGHLVLIDSTLENPVGGGSALVAEQGELFARNLKIQGYEKAITARDGKTVERDALINDEFVSSLVVSTGFPKQRLKSLALEVKEVPAEPVLTDSEWANVEDYGAKGDGKTDDTEAIEKALNDSSKLGLYFPRWNYCINRTLKVPAHIQVIDLCFGQLKTPKNEPALDIAEVSDSPFLLSYGRVQGGVDHSCRRTLVLRRIWAAGALYRHTTPDPERRTVLHVVNVNGLGRMNGKIRDVEVWARLTNTEDRTVGGEAHYRIENSQLWVLGYKCEVTRVHFDLIDSTLEVLGGAVQQTRDPNFRKNRDAQPKLPIVRSKNSSFSYIARTAPGAVYQTVVEETRNDIIKTLSYNDKRFPHREGSWPIKERRCINQRFFPLIVGYTSDKE